MINTVYFQIYLSNNIAEEIKEDVLSLTNKNIDETLGKIHYLDDLYTCVANINAKNINAEFFAINNELMFINFYAMSF